MPGQDPGKHPIVENVKQWASEKNEKGHDFMDQCGAVINKMLQDRPTNPADAFVSYVAAHKPENVVSLKDIAAARAQTRTERLEEELKAYKEREEAWQVQEAKRKAREEAEARGEEYVSESEQQEGEEAPAEEAPAEEEGEPAAPAAPPAFARGLSELENADLNRAKAALKLIEKPEPALDEEGNPIEEEGEGDAGPTNEEFQIPDIMDDANLFQNAGVGFTMEESYKITLALKYLAERNPLNYVRLFGKILGTNGDYIVAESEFKEGEGRPEGEGDEAAAEEEGEPDPAKWKPKAEPMGEGINKLTYWVCSYPGAPWTRLPDVTPDMIIVSRKIRKYFTGDLEAKVHSYPALDWTEKHLLRAQIARIAASTFIVPDKYFITEEEEEGDFTEKEGEVAEEPGPFGLKKVAKPPADWTPADVTQAKGWVHYHPIILSKQSVCQYQKPPKIRAEGEEEEEEEEDPDAPIPVPDEEGHRKILSTIGQDTHLVDNLPINPRRKVPAWTIRNHFNNVVSVSSNHWPGAVTVSRGPSRYANLYIGWGLKEQRGDFTMYMPPDLQKEFVVEDSGADLAEEVDPTNAEELFKIEEEKRAAEAAAAGEDE